MPLLNKRITRLFRSLHRDIGYFLVGMTVVYALSGILLSHPAGRKLAIRESNFAKQYPPSLSIEDLKESWEGPQLSFVYEKGGLLHLTIHGGKGTYTPETGLVEYTTRSSRNSIRFLHELHFNRKKGWHIMALLFGGCLIFLAISGLFIVPGKKGFFPRGCIGMALGFAAIVIYAFL